MKVLRRIVMVISLLAMGWFARQLVPSGTGERKVIAAESPAVSVMAVKRVEFNPPTEYVGHVEPAEVTDILPQIDGYVRKVGFTEGAHVAAGELLFEIDDEQYVAARNLRYSEVQSAQAKVLVAQSELERVERYYKRLAAADDRGITATERDNAEMALASAKAALNSAKAAVEQAKAAAAIADFNLKHTKIHSPIAGRIGKAFHHVGDYVSPSKSALAKVVKMDPMRVTFPITDRDYDAWRKTAALGDGEWWDSMRLRLRLANGEVYSKCGKIEFGDNEMNRQTGTLVMYVAFPNAEERLMPNAFVRVIADAVKAPRELVIPASAVVLSDDGERVWVLDEQNKVKSVAIKAGATWKGMTMIKSGLKEGEQVVSAGGFKLKAGMTVRRLVEDAAK